MNLLEQRHSSRCGTSVGGQRLHQKQRAAARPPSRDWPSSGAAGGEDAGNADPSRPCAPKNARVSHYGSV